MIVCCCNVFSDAQVRSVIANSPQRPRMSRVYASLHCAAQCGRCAKTISGIILECRHHAASEAPQNIAR